MYPVRYRFSEEHQEQLAEYVDTLIDGQTGMDAYGRSECELYDALARERYDDWLESFI